MGDGMIERGRMKRQALVLVLLIGGGLLFLASHSVQSATALPVLWQKCPPGAIAGQCSEPRGVVADPDSGNVYVVDRGNNRVNEFSPWGTFVKSFGWGVATGAPELQTCGPGATPPTTACQAGLEGGGPGQFADPRGIAIDSTGALYVYDTQTCTGCGANRPNRVQKFSPDGDFILMFGKEVNLTKVAVREAQEAASEPVTVTADEENVCTAASGDNCGTGKQGSGPGEFGTGPLNSIDPEGSFISVGPADEVAVGGQERIQVFDADGHFVKSIAIPGRIVRALALDIDGNAWVAFTPPGGESFVTKSEPNVFKLGPTGNELCQATIADPRALTTDAQGRVYVAAGIEEPLVDLTVHRFSSACVEDEPFAFTVTGLETFDFTTGIATSSACGIEGNLYYTNARPDTSFVRAYYPSPDPELCPPPGVPPTVEAQYAESTSDKSATVGAEINPHFWPDTTYYVQWGTEDCRNQPSACENTELFPGASLAGQDDVGAKTAPVTIDGLQPNTTYYYRFVASSGGGGAVYGIAPEGGEATPEEGLGGSFTTFPTLPAPKTDCPNQTFRGGHSARLPDCRAYEMVSPVDKEGGEIRVLINSANDPAGLFQGSVDGNRMTFSSYRAFSNPQSSPYTSQYLGERTSGGWSTAAISPPQEGPRLLDTEVLESSYKAFDDDLCNGWVLQMFKSQLTSDALDGYTNLFRRSNCPPAEGSYEAITDVSPTWEPATGDTAPLPVLEFIPSIQGFSEDGSHTVFRSAGDLATGAASCTPAEKATNGNQCPRQVYDFHNGEPSLVCVLPNGNPFGGSCSAGTGNEAEFKNTFNSVYRAVSADGSRIFWTDKRSGPGRLFVRINGTNTALISTPAAWFWAAAVDGSKVIYTAVEGSGVKGALSQFDVDQKAKNNVAGEVTGVLGASDDATKIYFTSNEVLTTEANSEGQQAQDDQNNLYLYDSAADTYKFVGTLADDDVNDTRSAVNTVPMRRTSRVSPDGSFAAFTSSAPLTGADNRDVASGQPDDEVFLYDATADELRCVSCSATGTRPRGRRIVINDQPIGPWIASSIPGWPTQTHPSRALSDDGSRLFFNSTSRLLLSDTNNFRDVYEWQPGASQAACEAKGAELFLKEEGGCLSLISAQSPADSEFLDASASGRDVFFSTESSLLLRDPAGVDVYDAREGGGFDEPDPPGPSCVGDACQQAPPAPGAALTPPSATFHGPESKPAKGKKSCPKGKVRRKVRGKVRCVVKSCPKGKVRRKGRCVKKNKQQNDSQGKQGKRKAGGRR